MSPIEPISPVSPTDASPISPVKTNFFMAPATPTLTPSVHLPRLLTSFQNVSSNIPNIRKMSLQFQLPTPSPLSLGHTPWTAVQGSHSPNWDGNVERLHKDSAVAATPQIVHSPQYGRIDTSISMTTDLLRRTPALFRQNANEGLENLCLEGLNPTLSRTIDLPLRLNTIDSNEPQRVHPCSPPPWTRLSIPTATTLLTPRPRARSPIFKHKRARKSTSRTSSPSSPKLFIRPILSPQTKRRQDEITNVIVHLSHPLVPLVSVTTGLSHPEFPTSLLQFQLLTHAQLDDLASWYHQTHDAGRQRWMYPCPIGQDKTWCQSTMTETANGEDGYADVDLDTKRRRWGRFIGLKGCESPVGEEESVEEMERRLDREWREAMRRAREQDRLREKIWRGRF